MKNKLMERPFNGVIIKQRIDNEHLCVTDLFRHYNAIRDMKGWPEKHLQNFWRNKETVLFMEELIKDLSVNSSDSIKGRIHTFMEKADFTSFSGFRENMNDKGTLKVVKALKLYSTKGRGDNRETYCHPYLFVKIAMWLNPQFEAKVIRWISDNLITSRISAGEGYKEMCAAIQGNLIKDEMSPMDRVKTYQSFARLLNVKVFGESKGDLRQLASQDQLDRLNILEKTMGALISVGVVTDLQSAIEMIGKL